MPSYLWKCPKKHYFEEWQSFADYDKGLLVRCTQHDKKCKRLLSPQQMIGGTSSFKMTASEEMQLGTSFNNTKEMDRFLKANKLEPCHHDSAKPKETPMDKIRNSKQYQDNMHGFVRAVKEKARGGISDEVKPILGKALENEL
jgi:hypothetical protein